MRDMPEDKNITPREKGRCSKCCTNVNRDIEDEQSTGMGGEGEDREWHSEPDFVPGVIGRGVVVSREPFEPAGDGIEWGPSEGVVD